jgi:PAS domain-containing protein
VFQNAPAPLFLLEPDGTIRRANGKAGDLIGAPPGYATGRPLTAFVDLPSRAAVAEPARRRGADGDREAGGLQAAQPRPDRSRRP